MEATVVNFLPLALEEKKPSLIPERYYIPAGTKQLPGILHVKDGRSTLYIRDGRTFPVPEPGETIAKSLCDDYKYSLLEADEEACPALFFVIGKHSANDIITKFKDEVDEVRRKQSKWFVKLVKRADDDWSTWKQHRMITDIQRYAAEQLGMINKEWYHTVEPTEFTKCPACSKMVEATAAICHNCQFVVNPARAKELGILKEEAS